MMETIKNACYAMKLASHSRDEATRITFQDLRSRKIRTITKESAKRLFEETTGIALDLDIEQYTLKELVSLFAEKLKGGVKA